MATPFSYKMTITLSICLFIFLFIVFTILQVIIDWPESGSKAVVLAAIFLFSLIPILLALVINLAVASGANGNGIDSVTVEGVVASRTGAGVDGYGLKS